MRLGGPLYGDISTPELWIAALRRHGYGAAFCPLDANATDDQVRGYAQAASAAGVVIAEVGAWSNPLSPDTERAAAAMKKCMDQLALAERIGARCCVNIAGSRGEKWDGPCAEDLTSETFDRIVECVRKIIDAVRPTRTFYTLETMPWMYPDSIESYLDLIRAIGRKAFAVHFDPVNLVCSPQRYFNTTALLRAAFEKLGPHIRSCHAKDILLGKKLTTHLDEVRPGLGGLDYATFLSELNKLEPDACLMLEHLPSADEYSAAAAHIRSVAERNELSFIGPRAGERP